MTIRILSHYRVTGPAVTCAALLHNAVEDHAAGMAPGGTRQEALAVLAGRFGGRTAALVAAVTNPGWEPGRDEHEQYREHVTASLAASPWARVIKASDFIDNAVGIIHTHRAEAGQAGRQVRAAGARPARAHPAPGHPAGDRCQGHDRRPVRHRPETIRRDQAQPTSEPANCGRNVSVDYQRRWLVRASVAGFGQDICDAWASEYCAEAESDPRRSGRR